MPPPLHHSNVDAHSNKLKKQSKQNKQNKQIANTASAAAAAVSNLKLKTARSSPFLFKSSSTNSSTSTPPPPTAPTALLSTTPTYFHSSNSNRTPQSSSPSSSPSNASIRSLSSLKNRVLNSISQLPSPLRSSSSTPVSPALPLISIREDGLLPPLDDNSNFSLLENNLKICNLSQISNKLQNNNKNNASPLEPLHPVRSNNSTATSSSNSTYYTVSNISSTINSPVNHNTSFPLRDPIADQEISSLVTTSQNLQIPEKALAKCLKRTPASNSQLKHPGALPMFEYEEIEKYPHIYFYGTRASKYTIFERLNGLRNSVQLPPAPPFIDPSNRSSSGGIIHHSTGPSNLHSASNPSAFSHSHAMRFDDENGDYKVVVGDHIKYRYEILSILGKGSFGKVLRCIDHKEGKIVAIKVIRNRKRFQSQASVEAKILQSLMKWDPDDCHHIVRFTESFYFRGHLFLVTELLGINLYEFLKFNHFQGVSMNLLRFFTVQMLASIELLSSHNIIHCDIKPENILLRSPGSAIVKLIDFGSSCFKNERVYTYIQSRFYRAPEVILGIPYGPSIDMWSLGCVVAELYTGYPLFSGENESEQLACIMEVLGLPPRHIIEASTRRNLFFDSFGRPRSVISSKRKVHRVASKTLSAALKCKDPFFVDFISKCLDWNPKSRLSYKDAFAHEFIRGFRKQKRTAPVPASYSATQKPLYPSNQNATYKSANAKEIGWVSSTPNAPINQTTTIRTVLPKNQQISPSTHFPLDARSPQLHKPIQAQSSGTSAALGSLRKFSAMPMPKHATLEDLQSSNKPIYVSTSSPSSSVSTYSNGKSAQIHNVKNSTILSSSLISSSGTSNLNSPQAPVLDNKKTQPTLDKTKNRPESIVKRHSSSSLIKQSTPGTIQTSIKQEQKGIIENSQHKYQDLRQKITVGQDFISASHILRPHHTSESAKNISTPQLSAAQLLNQNSQEKHQNRSYARMSTVPSFPSTNRPNLSLETDSHKSSNSVNNIYKSSSFDSNTSFNKYNHEAAATSTLNSNHSKQPSLTFQSSRIPKAAADVINSTVSQAVNNGKQLRSLRVNKQNISPISQISTSNSLQPESTLSKASQKLNISQGQPPNSISFAKPRTQIQAAPSLTSPFPSNSPNTQRRYSSNPFYIHEQKVTQRIAQVPASNAHHYSNPNVYAQQKQQQIQKLHQQLSSSDTAYSLAASISGGPINHQNHHHNLHNAPATSVPQKQLHPLYSNMDPSAGLQKNSKPHFPYSNKAMPQNYNSNYMDTYLNVQSSPASSSMLHNYYSPQPSMNPPIRQSHTGNHEPIPPYSNQINSQPIKSTYPSQYTSSVNVAAGSGTSHTEISKPNIDRPFISSQASPQPIGKSNTMTQSTKVSPFFLSIDGHDLTHKQSHHSSAKSPPINAYHVSSAAHTENKNSEHKDSNRQLPLAAAAAAMKM